MRFPLQLTNPTLLTADRRQPEPDAAAMTP
jgi:hypothetical protein